MPGDCTDIVYDAAFHVSGTLEYHYTGSLFKDTDGEKLRVEKRWADESRNRRLRPPSAPQDWER